MLIYCSNNHSINLSPLIFVLFKCTCSVAYLWFIPYSQVTVADIQFLHSNSESLCEVTTDRFNREAVAACETTSNSGSMLDCLIFILKILSYLEGRYHGWCNLKKIGKSSVGHERGVGKYLCMKAGKKCLSVLLTFYNILFRQASFESLGCLQVYNTVGVN